MKTQQKRPVDSGVVGAAIGTAVGVGIGAAAVALSSKENRQKVLKKTATLKKQAGKTLSVGKKELNKAQQSLTKQVAGLTKTKKVKSSTLKNNAKALGQVKKKPSKSAKTAKTA